MLTTMINLTIVVLAFMKLGCPTAVFAFIALSATYQLLPVLSKRQIVARSGYVSQAAVLFSSQLTALGGLNLWGNLYRGSVSQSWIGYGVVAVFYFYAYSSLRMAEDPEQRGGAAPYHFFGFRRSRRLMFIVLFCYAVAMPIVILDLVWRGAKHNPTIIKQPYTCFLLMALCSCFTSLSIWTRYRLADGDRILLRFSLLMSFGVLALVAAVSVTCDLDVIIAVLSLVSLTALTLGFYWLSLAEGDAMPATSHKDQI